MPDNDSSASPLLAQSGGFSQQGQVDWVSLGKNTVGFTVDAVSRISKAGVEALTLYAATAIFSQVKLDAEGERLVLDSLKKIGTFSSANNALFFGFGTKSLVRTLSESSQGIACIGICSCLSEKFSTETSANILRELFSLYQPPIELTPSLRQWAALINACSDVFANTNFGYTLSGISRLWMSDNTEFRSSNATSESIAKALKGLFEVSNGNVPQIYIHEAIESAWIASVAHWFLGLSVAIENEFQGVIYQKANRKGKRAQDPQVLIRKAFLIPVRFHEPIAYEQSLACIKTLEPCDRISSVLVRLFIWWREFLASTYIISHSYIRY